MNGGEVLKPRCPVQFFEVLGEGFAVLVGDVAELGAGSVTVFFGDGFDPPHGGFGLGAERLLQTIAGAGNLRETTLFPRDMKRLAP